MEYTNADRRSALLMLIDIKRPRSFAPIVLDGKVYGDKDYDPEFIAQLEEIAGLKEPQTCDKVLKECPVRREGQ